MKTTKLFLSISAVTFAIAGVFATSSVRTSALDDPDVAIVDSEECLVVGKCTSNSENPCETPITMLPVAEISGGTCQNAINGTFHNP